MKAKPQAARLAEIRWLPTEEGGRESLPDGGVRSSYSPIMRLLDPDEDSSVATGRSLVVRQLEGDDELTDGGAEWLAEIAFRKDDAPHDALTVGRRFELHEGTRCVASGVVIGFAGDQSVCSAMLEPFDR